MIGGVGGVTGAGLKGGVKGFKGGGGEGAYYRPSEWIRDACPCLHPSTTLKASATPVLRSQLRMSPEADDSSIAAKDAEIRRPTLGSYASLAIGRLWPNCLPVTRSVWVGVGG